MLRSSLPTAILGLVAAFASSVPSGNARAAGADLESLQFKLSAERQALDVPLDALRAQYAKALERLRDEVTQAGDLAKRLQVDREIASHADPEKERPDTEDFGQLEKLRTIFDTRHAELVAQADTRREKLLLGYKAAFDALQKSLTLEDKIEEAVEARKVTVSLGAELERLQAGREESGKGAIFPGGKPSAEFAWETPFAGILGETSSTDLEFSGAPKHGIFGLAVVKDRMPKTFSVRGQIQVDAYYPGIVIGYESDRKPFVLAFMDKAGTQAETWHLEKRVKTGFLDLPWKVGSWEAFEILRDETGWSFKLGTQNAAIPLPPEIRGSRFGFMTYGPGTVKVRRLSVSTK